MSSMSSSNAAAKAFCHNFALGNQVYIKSLKVGFTLSFSEVETDAKYVKLLTVIAE